MEITVNTFAELESFYRDWSEGHYRLLVVAGSPGRQKSELAMRVCTQAQYLTCKLSAFKLYCRVYECRDVDLILDDVDVQKDPAGTSLLQSLTESRSPRLVAWETASPKLEAEGIPPKFQTTSRVLIISNNWRRLSERLAALTDRGMVIHFDPTHGEIHTRAATWFRDPEIYNFVGRHLAVAPRHSLRLYGDAADLKAAGKDWRNYLLQHWGVDPNEIIVIGLLEQPLSQAARARRFQELGGGVERTYYYIYERISRRVGNPLQSCSAGDQWVQSAVKLQSDQCSVSDAASPNDTVAPIENGPGVLLGATPKKLSTESEPVSALLHAALHTVADAAQRWQALRCVGANDEELRKAIASEFGHGGNGPGYSYRGGKQPVVRFDDGSVLKNRALLRAVRRLLDIAEASDATPDAIQGATS